LKVLPINKIKISEGVRVGESEKKITIDFYHLEFFVNGKWLLWNELSDGTRRLFYIVSEILSSPFGIFLIDEPELGLHPQQLISLMQFLKEQSKTKQIILTTHSPQILDILEINEFDRLIVSRYGKNGTELVRISEQEQENFKDALEKGLDFSDYWLEFGIEAESIQ
jgi:predicted ATP-dependent endonuclease of OLD family